MSIYEAKPENWRRQTKLIRGGMERSIANETSECMYLTSGYVYTSAEEAEQAFKGLEDRFIYTRYTNPTLKAFEERMALLEGARHCISTSSGMSAVFTAMMCQLRAGDRVVTSRALFSSCLFIIETLLPRYGIEVQLVDGTDLDQWESALKTPTKIVFIETPSNPMLEIIDIKKLSDIAHKYGSRMIVDNVFATPILQRPLQLGADIVIYSATKHIDGQGRVLGGVILFNKTTLLEGYIKPFIRHTGPCLSPFNAWMLMKALETLEMRVMKQCENALILAKMLSNNKNVLSTFYPGLKSHNQYDLANKQMLSGGTIISFEVFNGKKGAFNFLNNLRVIDISNNLGDSKSLITHPSTTTHQSLSESVRKRLGITPGLVRLSVGLEDVRDILADLEFALNS